MHLIFVTFDIALLACIYGAESDGGGSFIFTAEFLLVSRQIGRAKNKIFYFVTPFLFVG